MNKDRTLIGKENVIRERLETARRSPFKAYRDMTVGLDAGLPYFLYYEIATMLCGGLSGGAGFLLRKKLLGRLFGKVGGGLILGRNLTLRHPHRMRLGEAVTLDENCVLDARGGESLGIEMGDKVLVNRNCMLLAKNGAISIGERTSIGSNCVIVSMSGVDIGEAVLFAGGCYVSAGAYEIGDRNAPVMDQSPYSKGPIRIGDGSWIGTCAIILDGVSIGKGAIIGAGAVVTRDIPDYAIAAGVPARVIRMRD